MFEIIDDVYITSTGINFEETLIFYDINLTKNKMNINLREFSFFRELTRIVISCYTYVEFTLLSVFTKAYNKLLNTCSIQAADEPTNLLKVVSVNDHAYRKSKSTTAETNKTISFP